MFSRVFAAVCVAFAAAAQAQPAAPQPASIGYPTVAAALKALEAQDGNGTVVTHADGWTIVNEPLARAQWSFAPKEHAAFPSVVRRVVERGAKGEVSVQTSSLCEAPAAACEALLAEFAALNERVTQAVKARGRQGSQQQLPGQ